mgnify:CR=1 FL=1
MALIRSLALSQGGGIISYNQQAKQEENIVNIFIGLGGTGVDCLREIKTQVYNRIEPDLITNDGKVVYEHIRFLGVDHDIMSFHSIGDEDSRCNCLPLFESEMFALAGSGITLKAVKAVKQARDVYTQYAWLSDHIDLIGLDGYEPSGLRQEGRFLIMANANKFMARVQNVIADSKRGLCNPRVVIHIISGLGGATGSGIFLDVCYILREILKAECNTEMCGYFFTPDVNVAHVRIERVKKYIRVNGYAAMQELDYCMNLENNHGKFMQEYTGGKLIEWNRNPVDFCHLISALDNNGNVREDAYNYAMRVTSEYVFEFLVKGAPGTFTMKQHVNNLPMLKRTAEQERYYGYYVGYLSIGASSAIVPLKEINTYLATRLFERFSQVGKDIPDESDVWNFTVGVFGEDKSDKDIQSRVYDALYATLQGDSKEAYKQWDGSASQMEKNGDQEMVYFYEGQTSEKKGILAKNKERLLDAENRDSLISRVKKIMYTVITDINRGPVFGFNILNGANEFSIDNVISGLITTNTEKLNSLRTHTKGKKDAWNDAKKGWDDHNLINRGVRYNTYVNKTYDLEQQKYLEKSYMYMDELLNSVKLQVRNMSSNYYSVLSQTFKNLRETFKDNSSVLANGTIFDEVKGFEKALINIEDPNLQQALIGELRKVTPSTVFKQLIEALIKDEKAWKSDTQIARVVTGYFVGNNGIFRDFADKTIENFLEIAYDTDNMVEIAKRIETDWLRDTYSASAPLFSKDNNVCPGDIGDMCRLSVPDGAISLKNAANTFISSNQKIKLAEVETKDRILFLTSGMAFPMSACKDISEVERQYYSSTRIGTHYYEGKGCLNIGFCDWRDLPFLTPIDRIEDDKKLPDMAVKRRNHILQIYSGIEKYQLCKDKGNYKRTLFIVNDNYDEELNLLKNDVEHYYGDEKTSATAMREKRDELLDRVDKLRVHSSDLEYCDETQYSIAVVGKTTTETDFNRLLRDMICYSPVMLMEAEKSIKKLENGNKTLTELEEKIKSVDATLSKLADKEKVIFFNALFTGVIKLGKSTGEFTPIDEDGIEDETICLSKMDDEFEYNDILPYQVYKTFITLDSKTKNIMKEMSNKVINGSDEKVAEIVTELTKTFSNKNYKVWLSDANDNHTGDKEEIKEFLKETMRRFKTQCMKYDIEVEQ